MANLLKNTQDHYFYLADEPYKIQNTDIVKFDLNTKNTFLDADIKLRVKADAASDFSLSLPSQANNFLSLGSASNGIYSPTVTFTNASFSASSAGWFSSGTATDTVVIGKINQSVITNGASSVSNNDAITPTESTQTIIISEGYNTARTFTIDSMAASTPAVITSGASTISSLSFTYDSQNSNFTISGTGDVSAPTVGTSGYISSSVGTRNSNTNGAVVNATVGTIHIGTTTSTPTTTIKPVITQLTKPNEDTWVDGSGGSAVTTKPTTGVYISVSSTTEQKTVKVSGIVTQNGYGNTDNFVTSLDSLTFQTSAADKVYIPIAQSSNYSASIGTITSSNLTVGNKSSNSYPINVDLSIPATLSASTNGWFSSGTATGSASSVSIGSIDEATFSVSDGSISVATAGYVSLNTTVASITTASLANQPTANVTYTDTSSTAPILIQGDYLYINAGYTGNQKISLAHLVPDTLDNDKLFAPANYILTGYAAFDADGVQINGSMPRYSGDYTVT